MANYADAIFHFNQSLRCIDKNASVLIALGKALSHEGKFIAASKAFKRAQSLSNSENEKNYLSFLISSIYLRLGDPLEAISLLEKILVIFPQHLPTRIKLISAYMLIADEKRQIVGCFGYKNSLESALKLSINGLNHSVKSVWILRYIGRILMLFIKNEIFCDEEILDTIISNTWVQQETETEFNPIYISELKTLREKRLFECTIRCLLLSCKLSLGFADLHAFCMYDLAICTYFCHVRAKRNNGILKASIQIIRSCIETLPDVDIFWNAAGIFLESLDLGRSQHCLIKSICISDSVYLFGNNLRNLHGLT